MKTELRIGNWVKTIEGEIQIQNGWEIDEGNETHPIPLTEEWLERFNWNPPKDIGVSFSLTTDEIHFVAGNYYKKIEYVHQLQNLYFALTGEELTVKEPKKCKYVKREGESCTLNDNCTYPNCK